MINSTKQFWESVGKKKSFWIPVLFFTIASYGFSVFNRTVGVDDLASDLYIGSGHVMIAAGRWGMVLWNKLVAIPRLSPSSDRLLATCFLLLTGILLSALFFDIHHLPEGKQFVCKYTVLSCCLITYPILGEIWDYSGANYMSTGGMLISVVTCYYLQTRQFVRMSELLVATALMTLPMSSYESGVLFYITLVCAILFYKYCIWSDQRKRSLYWKKAFQYAAPLIGAYFLRWLIGNILRLILGVVKGQNGATGIAWGKDPFFDVLRKLIIDTFLNYVVNGIVYLPIMILLFAESFLIGYSIFLSLKKKSSMILAGGVLLVASVYILPFVQGTFMPYRTAIPLSMLTSFSAFCCMESIERKKQASKLIASCLALYLLWVQSAYLNSELALNNQRSENEMRTMSIVAHRILSTNEKKPVVFIGEYEIGEYFRNAKKDYIDSSRGRLYQKVIEVLKSRYGDYYYTFFHITEFPDSNVNSMINHSLTIGGMMERYLSYLGYDIQVIDRAKDPDVVVLAEKIVDDKKMHAYDILETDDYIIATLELVN